MLKKENDLELNEEEKSSIDGEASKATKKTNKEGDPKKVKIKDSGADNDGKHLDDDEVTSEAKKGDEDDDSANKDNDVDGDAGDTGKNKDDEDGEDDEGKMKKEKKTKSKQEAARALNDVIDSLNLSESELEEAESLLKVAFEAQLKVYAIDLEEKIEEAVKAKYEAELATIEKNVAESLEAYTDKTAKEYFEANKVAIAERADYDAAMSFMASVQEAAKKLNIVTTPELADIKESVEAELDEKTTRVDALVKENTAKDKEIFLLKVEAKITELTSDMTVSEKEKFNEMAESFDFDSVEDFEKKAIAVKEHFFKESSTNDDNKILDRFVSESPELGVGGKAKTGKSLFETIAAKY